MLLKYSFAFLKHGSVWTYRLATWAVLIVGFGFATAVIALRYLVLPHIDAYREPIARTISSAIGQPVSVGRIEGSWRGYRPELRLHNLVVHERGGRVALELDRVDTVLSWISLLVGDLDFHAIEISALTLEIRRDSLGMLWVAGTPIERHGPDRGAGLDEWLIRQPQIIVRDARLIWIDEMRSVSPLVLDKVNLRIDRAGNRLRFGLTALPPPELASVITLRGDFVGGHIGELASWSGDVYGKFDYANLALAQNWLPLPRHLDSGLGVLRVWLGISERRLISATADVNLVNVSARLAPDLAPLALNSLSGRLHWASEPQFTTFSMSRVAFQTVDGVQVPQMSLSLRRSRRAESRSELAISALDLAPIAQLAEFLPLDPGIRDKIAAFRPAGTVKNLRASWGAGEQKNRRYSLQAEFQNLAVSPVDRIPGFQGMNGTLSATESGGALSLQTQGGGLDFPRVFAEPVPLDFLSAEADWRAGPGRVSVAVRNASFTNQHAAGKVSGTYEYSGSGRGTVDIHAALVRGEAKDVWRYMPNSAPGTREWLKRSVLAGHSNDARLHLTGPLEKFPFADRRSGTFEVLADVQNGVLKFAEGWPPIEGVSGEFIVRGDTIEVRPRSGRLMGIDISKSQASIPGLGSHEENLLVKGEAAGQVAEFLRFIELTPVARYTNRVTAKMSGSGIGNLGLELDLPLHDVAAVKVAGRFDMSGKRFDLDPRVPALTDYAAGIDFTERGVSLRNGRAQLLGNPFQFRSGASEDGAMVVNLTGQFDAARFAAEAAEPLSARLEGSTDWRGKLVLSKGNSRLHFESDLAGLGSRLPAPLDKAPALTVPLVVDMQALGERQSQYTASLGNVGSAQWLVADGDLLRGTVSFAGRAALPETDGLQVTGALGTLDLDGWRRELAGRTRASSGEGGFGKLNSLDLKIGILDFAGRRFSDMQIKGQRTAEGWRIALGGPQAKGNLIWTSGDGGRFNARFAMLSVPVPPPTLKAPEPREVARELRESLPGFDVVADSFTFEGKNLGRMELRADPEPTSWQLERLTIINPDGRLDVRGKWMIAGLPRTELDVKIDASDIGKLLTRLGYDEGIQGGKGTLSGPVSWLGSPYRPDLPTLSGQLRLEANGGRFARLEPGAAKLLGILSLQALPRRITLDFRDVFSSGFSFDSITAHVAVSDGVAHTEDFRMDGASARVAMKGDVNLAAETQDLRVRVFPQLSTAAAVAGAAVINPLVGVAALIVQKALGDPVEKLAALEYHVTGPWADPKVERIEHKQEAAPSRK